MLKGYYVLNARVNMISIWMWLGGQVSISGYIKPVYLFVWFLNYYALGYILYYITTHFSSPFIGQVISQVNIIIKFLYCFCCGELLGCAQITSLENIHQACVVGRRSEFVVKIWFLIMILLISGFSCLEFSVNL